MKNPMFFLLAALFLVTSNVEAQKYFTREGSINFSSDAPLEKITADNQTASSVIDFESGNIQWAVLIKAFQFEKALMQEHFNENYMESGKFPKSTFKGQVVNIDEVDLNKDGEYPVTVEGSLTVHGVTQEIETEATIIVKDGTLAASTTFEVAVADYKIEIPKVVRDNIAKIVQISINANYQELNKG